MRDLFRASARRPPERPSTWFTPPRLGVALDDPVRNEVEGGPLRFGQAGEKLFGAGDEIERLGARIVQRVGLRDPRADRGRRLGLSAACGEQSLSPIRVSN